MLRNYVKIALRTLWKQKGITAINVLGLAAGMAVCLLVGLLFWDQITHDDFHPDADRIYRVTTEMQNNSQPFATSSAGLAPTIRDRLSGVETATRMTETGQNIVLDNQGYRAQGLYAEPSFFDVFGFELEKGDPEAALAKPNTAVLTKDLARRLFGDAEPMGQTLRLAEVGPVTVTGIINRDAYRSHLPFDALYSFATLEQTRSEKLADWNLSAYSYYTYLRLKKGRAASEIEGRLQEIRTQHLPPATNEDVQVQRFQLQALSALPLGNRIPNEIAEGLLPTSLAYILAALALLVLVAAGFNYVNLSTARSLTRAREVGVRKTMGAHRQQVFGQFVSEAVVVSMLALGLALLLLQVLVPAYNRLPIMPASITVEPGPMLYGIFFLFAIAIGALAGLYPAWHLSAFHPSRVLKASAQSKTPGFKWLTPRKALVVLQFAFAIVISVSAVIFYQQSRHLSETEYPIRMDDVARIELQDAAYDPFQQAARQQSGVQRVGGASHLPIISKRKTSCTITSDHRSEPVSPPYYALDYEAVQLLELPLVATQDFTEERFESGQAILISEAAVSAFGFSSRQEALGQPLTLERNEQTETVRVVGVVRDFPLTVSPEGAEPLVFHHRSSEFGVALARVEPKQKQAALAALEETWGQFDNVNPFEGEYLREGLRDGRRAAALSSMGGLLGVVAGLAVLISCLGLLGIATYVVQTRVREVGIRKALGATVGSLVALLSKDFLWLVGAAIALGLPVAWWANQQWLQGFYYRIELGVWPFALSAGGLLMLALLAIGSQTVRAAHTDPATTLRDE